MNDDEIIHIQPQASVPVRRYYDVSLAAQYP